jgi:serine protease Do
MDMPGEGRIERRRGAGSGVIVHPDGYVVTNHHVAGNANRIVCNLSDQQEVEAELVGTDPLADIAVLKINRSTLRDPDAPLPFARWGDSSEVEVSDTVFAMGSPAAISQSTTRGIVSNTKMIMPDSGGVQKLDGEDVGSIVRWIAHDATIFFGNSGGPLINERGEVIGINEIGFAGLSGAIPGNLARAVAEEIIEHGSVRRSWTGLTLQARLTTEPGRRGGLVANVAADSPAETAGIRPGDLLVRFGSEDIDCAIDEDVPIATARLLGVPVGEAVVVVVERDGERITTSLTTELRDRAQPQPTEYRSWGMICSDISRQMQIEESLSGSDGVMILSVRPGGASENALPPLASGDVIKAVDDVRVTSLADFAQVASSHATSTSSAQRTVALTLERDGAEIISVLEIGHRHRQRPPAAARKPWLGVETQVVTAELSRALGVGTVRGVRVIKLSDAGATANDGLAVGDIVTAVNGKPIRASRWNDTRVFTGMIHRFSVGEELTLTIVRDGVERDLTVTLGETPAGPATMAHFENEFLEIECRDLTVLERAQPETTDGGALVEDAPSGGWASLGGVRRNDIVLAIDGERIHDVGRLDQALATAVSERREQIILLVLRGSETLFLGLEPAWEVP